MSTRSKWVTALASVLFLAACLTYALVRKVHFVRFENSSQARVLDLRVSSILGSQRISRLDPGKAAVFAFRGLGAGSFRFEWSDISGKQTADCGYFWLLSGNTYTEYRVAASKRQAGDCRSRKLDIE
jgi:hypothetical protein